MAGRILANRPSSLRRRRSPASGRTSYGTPSHFGPPTAPNITASPACALAMGGMCALAMVRLVEETADKRFFGLEGAQTVRIHEGDELFHLGHHLRSDAVAGEKKELVGRHRELPRLNASRRDC